MNLLNKNYNFSDFILYVKQHKCSPLCYCYTLYTMSEDSTCFNWFFTFNNPNHDGGDGEVLYHALSSICSCFGFQYEQGDGGTPHYQGNVNLFNRTRQPSKFIKDPNGDLLFQVGIMMYHIWVLI